jgi:Carboxylesterase family
MAAPRTSRADHPGGHPVVRATGVPADLSELAAEFPGHEFATQPTWDGISITINYRLGALGFLAHPALADAKGQSGDYGLMDQQAALRWVQRNIAGFGGNPHDVTIFGESAGGLSVLSQVASPQAKGLFERAIAESGSYNLTQTSLASAEAAGEAFAVKAGCAGQAAACLRSLPVSTILADLRLRVQRRERAGELPAPGQLPLRRGPRVRDPVPDGPADGCVPGDALGTAAAARDDHEGVLDALCQARIPRFVRHCVLAALQHRYPGDEVAGATRAAGRD